MNIVIPLPYFKQKTTQCVWLLLQLYDIYTLPKELAYIISYFYW